MGGYYRDHPEECPCGYGADDDQERWLAEQAEAEAQAESVTESITAPF